MIVTATGYSHIQRVAERCHLLVTLLRHLEELVPETVHPSAQRHLQDTQRQPIRDSHTHSSECVCVCVWSTLKRGGDCFTFHLNIEKTSEAGNEIEAAEKEEGGRGGGGRMW